MIEFRRESAPRTTCANIRKSIEIEKKSNENQSASEPCQDNSIFLFPDATWHRFWSPRRAPRRSRAPFLAFRGALGDSPGTPGGRRGRSGMLSRRSGDAFGTLLHATESPEKVPGAILTRFWVPRGVSEDRFSVDFRGDFRFILRALHSAIPPKENTLG